jgi:hypothetical protein
MVKRVTARDMEREAARTGPSRSTVAALPAGEALRMLARRGLRPKLTRPDLPFPANLDEERAERLAALLAHYAFRLFLRGAIQHPEGFAAADATAYLDAGKAREFAEALTALRLAARAGGDRYRLHTTARSFGGTLEWFVGRALARTLGFDVAAGVKFHAPGVGGDLDVVAAAEGKLVYLELKSSPPKHVSDAEIGAFFDRVHVLRPDVTLFVVDTALRLSDKVVPMLVAELKRRSGSTPSPRRIERELWALTPHLYAVNARPDLIANIRCAIAEGLLALSPVGR